MSNKAIPDAPPVVKKEIKPRKPRAPRAPKVYNSDGELLKGDGTVDKRPALAKKHLENLRVEEALNKVKQADIAKKVKEKQIEEGLIEESEESEYDDDFEILEYVVKKKSAPIEVKQIEVPVEVPVEVIKEVIKEVPVPVHVPEPINQRLVEQNELLRSSLATKQEIENITYMRASVYNKKKR